MNSCHLRLLVALTAAWAGVLPLTAAAVDIVGAQRTGLPDAFPAKPHHDATSQLTLRQALALALERNPELAAFSTEIRANEAAMLQAGALPNPVLEAAGDNLGNTRLREGGDRTATLQIGQLIELGGKRAARIRLAESTRDLANWDYEAKRIDVLSRVTLYFIDVLAGQEQVQLAEATLRLAQDVADTVGKRVRAGRVSPVEETRAQVARTTAQIERDQARRQLAAARSRLTGMWNDPAPRFGELTGNLEVLPVLPAYENLAVRLRSNPDLARWTTEITRRQAALAGERAKAVPDITVSAGVRRFSEFSDNAYIVGVAIPLPIFNQNRGGILEASRRLDKAADERRAAELRAGTELSQVFQRASSIREEIEALRISVLPGARSAFESTTRGYELGRFAFLDVLDAQRVYFQARAQYRRALADYHRAVGDIERLIGAPLDEHARSVNTK